MSEFKDPAVDERERCQNGEHIYIQKNNGTVKCFYCQKEKLRND